MMGFPLGSAKTTTDPFPVPFSYLTENIDYWAVSAFTGYFDPPNVGNGGQYGFYMGYMKSYVDYLHSLGKKVLFYNGSYPYSGTVMIDADATHMRVFPWIAWKYGSDMYSYYHIHDYVQTDSSGAGTQIDPYVANYKLVNAGNYGSACASRGIVRYNGLGSIIYPGTNYPFPDTNLNLPGPVASILMKNWRRGEQDYEYLWLAKNAGYEVEVQNMVNQVVPAALDDMPANAPSGWPDRVNPPATWPARGYGFERVRRQLAELISGGNPATFADVPPDHPYYDEIEALYRAGYTAGCNTDPLMYCPEATMNRAESSVFVERGIHAASYDPPAPTSQVFADMSLDSWPAKWVTGLWNDQYTAGCGTDPLIYCPWQGHTRAEGCVFYLRMLRGASYDPPQPTQQTFTDVPLEAWYAKWVQAAYDAGLITACQATPDMRFCPDGPLTRALAAYMMVHAKGLAVP